jgi:predicted nucleic acid-binding protein
MSFAVVEALIVPAGAGGSGPPSVSSVVAGVRLVYPEDRAAQAVASRSGRISRSALRGAVQGLGHLCQLMDMVEVSDGIGRRAGALAESHFLQGYDAAHLTSAETLIDEAV